MKKMLIVTSDYCHPLRHRLHNILEPLKESFDIHIITLLPAENFNNSAKQYKLSNDITPIEIKNIPLATFLLACHTIKRETINEKYDICLAIGPYFGFATLLAKIDCPLIYEDTDRFEYFSKNKLSKLLARIIERYSIKKATHVISVGYSLAESAKEIRGNNDVSCIPNGVNYKMFSEVEINNPKNLMVYVGTVSDWSGLDIVISSIPLIKKEISDIKLLIIGDGEYLNKLKEKSKEVGVSDCIEILGKKDYREIPTLLSKCKIGLALYPENNLMKYAFTLKLIEYMAVGLPVITTNIGDGARIIKESNSGFITDYNVESFASAVIKLMKNDNLRNFMSKEGKEYAKRFDWSNLSSLEIEILNQVIKTAHDRIN